MCFAFHSHHGISVWPQSAGWHDVHWDSAGLLTGRCVCTDSQVGTFINDSKQISLETNLICATLWNSFHYSFSTNPQVWLPLHCNTRLMLLHHTGDVSAVNAPIEWMWSGYLSDSKCLLKFSPLAKLWTLCTPRLVAQRWLITTATVNTGTIFPPWFNPEL